MFNTVFIKCLILDRHGQMYKSISNRKEEISRLQVTSPIIYGRIYLFTSKDKCFFLVISVGRPPMLPFPALNSVMLGSSGARLST